MFQRLLHEADVRAALDKNGEDIAMPPILSAGLRAWIDERSPTGVVYKQDAPPSGKPALHARLVEVLDETTENEAHWGFRAIAHDNPRAVITRIKNACTATGLDRAVPQRRLVLLRRADWPGGPRTVETVNKFLHDGGVWHKIRDADLKVFDALRRMQAAPHALYGEWLVSRRPASNDGPLS